MRIISVMVLSLLLVACGKEQVEKAVFGMNKTAEPTVSTGLSGVQASQLSGVVSSDVFQVVPPDLSKHDDAKSVKDLDASKKP